MPGAAYYVDADGGSDLRDGLAPARAWKSLEPVNARTFVAGDRLLFRSGCRWTGQLRPKGSGAVDRPIRIGRYGNGALPVIDQAAAAGPVVLLENQDCWEIAGLEVSGGSFKPDQSVGGIHVRATTAGRVLKHIVIRDCVIRDILGTVKNYDSCAIWVGVPGWDDPNGLTTGFDGVLIENNRIARADRCGILVWTPAGPTGESQFRKGLIPSKQVVIRRNTLEDIGGDAILVLGSDKPLIERNLVRRSCIKAGDPALGREGYNPCAAAIWLHHCADGIMQFNAVHDSAKLAFNNDGMAFDFDFNCARCIVQYNYSRNNAGGFLLIMPSASDNITRYNISENDRDHVLFLPCDPGARNVIHNNTFYLDAGEAHLIARARICNNIFMAAGTASFEVREAADGMFEENCYAGNWRALPNDPGAIAADPRLVDPGKGGSGMGDFAGYRTRLNSPCRKRGVSVSAAGGKDILGAVVPRGDKPGVGACR